MIMLVGALIGCFVGWLGGRLLHMDLIEMITSISLSTVGAWTAGGIAQRSLHIVFGTSFDSATCIASLVGSLIGVAFYQLVFHPHHSGSKRHPPTTH